MGYVIQDQNGRFADDRMMFYSREDKRYIYKPFDEIYGIKIYPTPEMAEQILEKLNKINKKQNMGISFQINTIKI